MTYQRSMIGDVIVLTPRKNLTGGDETISLSAAINEVAAVGPAKVVMDLGEIEWVSSLGIGSMKRASTNCTSSGGWLRLARVGKRINNTLLISGLIIYFDTFETVQEAVTRQ